MTTQIDGVTGLQANRTIGTATNDNAGVGMIGEYISADLAFGSGIALTSTTYYSPFSISLTAGDWDVQAVAGYAFTGATGTTIWSGVSTTAATLGSFGTYSTVYAAVVGFQSALPSPVVRISLAATTTVYIVIRTTYTSGSCVGFGTISARRVR